MKDYHRFLECIIHIAQFRALFPKRPFLQLQMSIASYLFELGCFSQLMEGRVLPAVFGLLPGVDGCC